MKCARESLIVYDKFNNEDTLIVFDRVKQFISTKSKLSAVTLLHIGGKFKSCVCVGILYK